MTARNQGLDLLIVTDNPDDFIYIKSKVRASSSGTFNIIQCNDFYDALNLIALQKYDVMLLSLALSDIDGPAAVAKIQSIAPGIPIVILGQFHNEEHALEAVQAGAQDYLVKGIGDEHLFVRSLRYAIERKRTEQHLIFLAQYDTLTGLPNRTLFRDRLLQALNQANRKSQKVALMFLDLDHFKSVNDSLGHDAGDKLLTQVATRLRSVLRNGDTIARLGGDEFTIILEEITDTAVTSMIAEKIIDVMSRSFVVDGNEIFVTTSIGIATYPGCGDDDHSLIKNADAALYNAKEQGRSTYRYFDEEMNAMASRRLSMVTNLRHAVNRNEFELYYQPQVNVKTLEVVGMEALLRWNNPKLGLVAPGEFISLLEETGMVVDIGKWIFYSACDFNRRLQDRGLPPLQVSVNLSPRQFLQADLVSTISKTLMETRLHPRYLQLEITEGMLVDNVGRAAAILRALHTIGVKLSLDDFGTGYSSLSYLKQFPLHSLKLDRSFVKNLDTVSRDAAIVTAIINLGHGLNMSVVAEGVECEAQMEYLRQHQCDLVQGFLFGRPMPEQAFTDWLREFQVNPESNIHQIKKS